MSPLRNRILIPYIYFRKNLRPLRRFPIKQQPEQNHHRLIPLYPGILPNQEMNKSFPHQLIIPPHKIIGNHLHPTSFPRSGDCLTHPLLTMRSKIYPVKLRNILKYPFRNLPGPAILLKAILRPNDLNPFRPVLPDNLHACFVDCYSPLYCSVC